MEPQNNPPRRRTPNWNFPGAKAPDHPAGTTAPNPAPTAAPASAPTAKPASGEQPADTNPFTERLAALSAAATAEPAHPTPQPTPQSTAQPTPQSTAQPIQQPAQPTPQPTHDQPGSAPLADDLIPTDHIRATPPPPGTEREPAPELAGASLEPAEPADTAAATPEANSATKRRRTLSPVERAKRRNRIVGVVVVVGALALGGGAFAVALDQKQARLEEQARESYESARERCLRREQEGAATQVEPVDAAVADLRPQLEEARQLHATLSAVEGADPAVVTELEDAIAAAQTLTDSPVEPVTELCTVVPGPAAKGLAEFEVEVVTGTNPALEDVQRTASQLSAALEAARVAAQDVAASSAKDQLTAALTAAQETLDGATGLLWEVTLQPLADAIESAQALVSDDDATSDQIASAVTELNEQSAAIQAALDAQYSQTQTQTQQSTGTTGGGAGTTGGGATEQGTGAGTQQDTAQQDTTQQDTGDTGGTGDTTGAGDSGDTGQGTDNTGQNTDNTGGDQGGQQGGSE